MIYCHNITHNGRGSRTPVMPITPNTNRTCNMRAVGFMDLYGTIKLFIRFTTVCVFVYQLGGIKQFLIVKHSRVRVGAHAYIKNH